MLKRGVILVLMLVILSLSGYGFFPSQNYGGSVGFDFHVNYPRHTIYVLAIYDNTDIYYDTTLNGIYTPWTTLNSQGTTTSTTLLSSTKIHATKPIMVTESAQRSLYNYYGSSADYALVWGGYLVPAQNLVTEFYVANPAGNLYVVATQSNTNLLIDKTNDGTWETNVTLILGVGYSYDSGSVQAGSRVKADKPVSAKQRPEWSTTPYGYTWGFDIENTTGTHFYVGSPYSIVYIVALEDGTTVNFDTNLDGWIDSSVDLNKTDTFSNSSLTVSTYIYSNKSILVSQRYVASGNNYVAGGLVNPAPQLSLEYFVAYPFDSYVYIAATHPNTNLLIDKTNNGTWDTNTTINLGAENAYDSTYVQAGSRIRVNRPVLAYQRSVHEVSGAAHGYWGHPLVAASIATTSDVSPSPADFHTLVNISNKVWNMLENVYNLTISGSVPDDFTPWPSTSILNITIGKYYANNGSLIGSTAELPVSLASGGGKYSYTLNYSNTSLLNDLGDEQYYEFSYKATTPNSTRTFLFEPFTADIAQATVWRVWIVSRSHWHTP